MSIHFGTDFVYSLSQLLKLSSCYTILKIDILGVSLGDTNIEGHDNLIDTFLGNLQAFKMQFFLRRKLFSLKHVTVSKQYNIFIMQLRILVLILYIKISNFKMQPMKYLLMLENYLHHSFVDTMSIQTIP